MPQGAAECSDDAHSPVAEGDVGEAPVEPSEPWESGGCGTSRAFAAARQMAGAIGLWARSGNFTGDPSRRFRCESPDVKSGPWGACGVNEALHGACGVSSRPLGECALCGEANGTTGDAACTSWWADTMTACTGPGPAGGLLERRTTGLNGTADKGLDVLPGKTWCDADGESLNGEVALAARPGCGLVGLCGLVLTAGSSCTAESCCTADSCCSTNF